MKMIHETEIKVRFAETDALGHVNNTNFFVYMEVARIEFFEKLDTSMSINKWPFIVASAKCDFIEQTFFNQTLIIETTLSRIGSKSFTLTHRMKDKETGKTVAKGEVVIVHFNFEAQQSEVIPPKMREVLEQYLISVA